MRARVCARFPAQARWPDGRRELFTATLIQYTEGGSTAMARTVGITSAIAAQMLLNGSVKSPGVVTPMSREWYEPILRALAAEGIALVERRSRL